MDTMRAVFDTSGRWLRGNLHMHTTRSDGVLPPEEAIGLYRAAGYDFLALTDHWKQSETVEQDGFLQLAGCEFDTGDMRDYPVYHIVGVGMERTVSLERPSAHTPQRIIDAVREAGGAAILAHPAWSLTNPDEVPALRGLSAAEVYNTFSGIPWSNARPESSLYFDLWANRGLFLPCTAADDCHWYTGEQTRSYMMANAPALTAKDVRAAILAGNFYASQGPRFENIWLDGEAMLVRCAPVQTIVFYSSSVYCADRLTQDKAGTPVTEGRYKIKETDRFVRVALIDAEGRYAWGPPIAVNRPETQT